MSHIAKYLQMLILALAMIAAHGGTSPSAMAQTDTSRSGLAADLDPLIEKAKKRGMEVIILSPVETAKKTEPKSEGWQELGLRLRQDLVRILRGAPQLPHEMWKALKNASPDGTWWWLLKALGIAALAIVAMHLVRMVIMRFNRNRVMLQATKDPENRADKIGFLLFRATIIMINCILNFATGMVIAIILDYNHEPSRQTVFIIFVAYIFYWVFRAVILFNIIAHDLPKHRMINLNDEDAKTVQYDWRNSIVVSIVLFAITAWMDALQIDRDAHKLMLLATMTVTVIVFIALSIKHRRQNYNVLIGAGDPASKPQWRRTYAASWHVISIVYFVAAWVVSSYRTVLDLPSAFLPVTAPVIAFLGGLGIYGIVLLVLDRLYLTRQRRFDLRVAMAHAAEKQRRDDELAAIDAELSGPTDEDDDRDTEDLIVNKVMAEKKMEEMPAFKPVFKPLLEQAAGVLITIAAVGFVLGAWEVDIGESGNPVTAFLDTLIIVFVGWFLYRAVAVYIDNQLEEEGGVEEAGEPGEEMSGQGASRITTLLPLIRNVMIAAIAILTLMVVLSNMGVDIAPLFAGAGVIGLAIGFGAQTLIRDIFSGGFFLFDDAFRRGEYIELENIRGTVEKISLRSFQLRHHNGPLHTIPFGEIKQLTNYSRDWVMMKLPLRLTYDTDVERVRKLIKNLGKQLLDHPQVGELFLQPLKSQGVYRMEDSAMIIRVKFMTKPGDQFVTRKVVYAEIRELFEKEGIKFAHKEVTVRLADEPHTPLNEPQKTAIAAAAHAAAEEAEGAEPAKVDDGP